MHSLLKVWPQPVRLSGQPGLSPGPQVNRDRLLVENLCNKTSGVSGKELGGSVRISMNVSILCPTLTAGPTLTVLIKWAGPPTPPSHAGVIKDFPIGMLTQVGILCEGEC